MQRLGKWVLVLMSFCAAQLAQAQTNNIIGTYTNWPTDTLWQALPQLNDPTNNIPGCVDFVGDTTNPCGYWAYNNNYVFFRMRLRTNTVVNTWGSGTGPLFVMVSNTAVATNSLQYAFVFDAPNGVPNANHELEMSTNGNMTAWGTGSMNDVDGSPGTRGTNDINGNSRTTDGYLRSISNVVSTNFGTNMFVDFAVSWNYLTNYTSLKPNQVWQVTFGSGGTGGTPNDNNQSGAPGVSDVAGTESTLLTTGWSAFLTSSVPATVVHDVVVKVDRDGTGNHVKWRTGYEVSNLGFNVYRSGSKGLEQLNPALIAGSALLAGPDTTMTAGNSYSWWDPDGAAGATYYVESVDLNGTKEMHTPAKAFVPASYGSLSAVATSSRLLTFVPPNAYTVVASQPQEGVSQVYVGRQAAALFTTIPSVPTDQEMQQAIAAGPAVKIGVKTTGWYQISRADLLAAGLDSAANPDLLQLYADGVQQQIMVNGQRGKTFDSISFYGIGLDSIYSDTRVYWLVVGTTRGARIRSQPALGRPGAAPSSFPYTISRADKVLYFAALHNGEDVDNFFGPVIGASPVNQSLVVGHVAKTGSAVLQVNVQGLSAGNHTVNVQLNGSGLGKISLSGRGEGQSSFNIAPSLLREGTNTVTLSSAGAGDYSLIDTVSLTYPHTYVMDGPIQVFTAPAGPVMIKSQYDQVMFFDVNSGKIVSQLQARKSSAGSEGYTYQLYGSTRGILAVAPSAGATQAAWIKSNDPSSWHDASNGAQFVVITHASLMNSARRLAAFRNSMGMTTVVVNVEDIYDEFSFGSKSVSSVRSFLQTASTGWSLPPRYVLLLGDATYDPRNYLGIGGDIYDLVPTRMIDTVYSKTASDDWIADFNGTGIPSMAIGRLSARTLIDADLLVSKIIGYESSRSDAWRQQMLLVSDLNDGFDFPAQAAGLLPLIPPTMTTTRIQRGLMSDADASAQIATSINSGTLIVDYLGHGSTEIWRGNLLTSEKALALSNGSRLPFFVDMTCLNGMFHDLTTTCLGEALMLAPNGGAVGVWASSSLTDPSAQVQMNHALFSAMFEPSTPLLGDAVLRAKAATDDNDVRRSWILLGDPTLRIR